MLPLNEIDIRALREALDREYRSFATHDRALHDFGDAPQLQRIRDIEAMHIRVLQWLHARYGVPRPRNRWRRRVPHFRTPALACAAAIEAEKEAIRTYRDFIGKTCEADVLSELRNLERASRNGHLPALRAWAKELARRKPPAPRRKAPGALARSAGPARPRRTPRSDGPLDRG